MQFGIRIPSIAWPDLTHERSAKLRDYVQRCEDLGFDACWVIDHFLKTPLIYAVSWLALCLIFADGQGLHQGQGQGEGRVGGALDHTGLRGPRR